jgi:uncharacterized protein YccT (UPF0319 family)
VLMAKFTINHDVKQPVDKTFETVQKILSKGDDLKKYDPKIVCTFDSATKTCNIKGSQFKADLKIEDHNQGSQIVVTVDLPLLLMPFKGKITESLVRLFEKHLG